MVEYKVIDNFLSEDIFLKTISKISDLNFSWKYNNMVTGNEIKENMNGYFTYLVYTNQMKFVGNFINDSLMRIFRPILNKMDIKRLIRIKLNLYTRTDYLVHHDDHIDYPFSHKGGLFSLNTCDGFTVIDGKEIPSVANRMIFFDPSIPHHSTNCTNAPHRMNININYF